MLLFDGLPRLFFFGMDATGLRHRANAKKEFDSFPDTIKQAAKAVKAPLDTRSNGPAIVAFLVSGGVRPKRFGSQNSWSVHHIYSGKFPYIGKSSTLHAAKSGQHFTQSAGVVAVHPIADGMCDEYPFFAWLLRAEAFRRFGYDPDGVFSDLSLDQFGFVLGRRLKPFISTHHTGRNRNAMKPCSIVGVVGRVKDTTARSLKRSRFRSSFDPPAAAGEFCL